MKATLSCMQAAGMNDWSGQWAYRVGLPAKSGISGGLMIVVPNVMGIAIYSPLIDNSFNSGRVSFQNLESKLDYEHGLRGFGILTYIINKRL